VGIPTPPRPIFVTILEDSEKGWARDRTTKFTKMDYLKLHNIFKNKASASELDTNTSDEKSDLRSFVL